MKGWKVLFSKTVLRNKFLKVTLDRCRKSDGKIVKEYYKVHRPGVVIIAAFTKQKELVLIHQYRHPVKSWDYELPAGYIEPADKNNLKKAAARELLEETGYRCRNLKKIQSAYASAGLMSNTVNFFIGLDAEKIRQPQLDENEELKVKVTQWTRVLKMLQQEKIKDLGSVTGILLAKNHKFTWTTPPPATRTHAS